MADDEFDYFESKTYEEMRIILLGKIGCGKNSLGSSMMYQSETEMRSETVQCEWRTGTLFGSLMEARCRQCRCLLSDTPVQYDDDEISSEVGTILTAGYPGLHLRVRTDPGFTQTVTFEDQLPRRRSLRDVLQDDCTCDVEKNNTAPPADRETMITFLVKGGNIHTTVCFETLSDYHEEWCELQVCHRKMLAEFKQWVAEFVDYFEHKITEGRKTTTSAMKDAVVHIFAEVSTFTSYPLSLTKALLIIISLMTVGCSAMALPQAACTGRHSVVGEPTSVTCLFDRNLFGSRPGVVVQMFPFNATSDTLGKDVLMCSWKKNTTTCFVEEGYSFNSNISDRLTLEIPAATPEIAGVYKCLVVSEVSPPYACSLTVTERSESTPTPTTTHATTGKETSNTTEPSWILNLVIVVLISLLLVCFTIRIFLKLYKRPMTKIQNRETEDIKTPLK